MTLLEKIKAWLHRLNEQAISIIGRERIQRINEKITYYPDRMHARMPEWSHRFIDPVKPYMRNPKYVWRLTGTVIVLLLTFIAYRALYDDKQLKFKEVAAVEYDEIEAPEGGFNPEYVRSVIVHEEAVDDHLIVPGRLAYDGDEIQKISARVQGRVERLFIHEGFYAKKGQPILSVYSPDFIAAEHEYLLANRALGVVAELKDKGITTDARDLVEASRNKLMIIGMSDDEILQLKRTGAPQPVLMIKSPINGVITSHQFKPGAFINLGDDLTTVANTDTVWFRGNIYEQDIQKVKVGQPLVLKSDAYPDTQFTGVIDFVGPSLNPDTHTLEVRATLKNNDGLLKPDVYATGVVTIGTGQRVVIPKEALIKEGNNAYVIQVLPGNHYKLRNITVSPLPTEDTVSVLRGLKDGSEIVTTGSVLVYESIKRKIR